MKVKLAHSYSSLQLFGNCPKRYYHQRITKEVKDEGGVASKYGERSHKGFEDRLKEGKSLPHDMAHGETMCATIEATARKLGGEVLVEHELVLNKNLKPTGWWDEDAWLRSKLDVFLRMRRSAIVLDWKTGKRKPDMKQMKLFAVQTFIHHPEIDKVKTVLVWLKDNPPTQDPAVFERSQLRSLTREVLEDIKRVEEAALENVWPAKPSGLCDYCPAKGICEFAQTRRKYR